MRCWALNLVVSNDTRTIRRGRSGRRTMGPSIDGGSRIGPPKTQQSARKYRNPRVKMTRPTPKTRDLRSRSDAHQVPLDYRRPFKIGNIVQTSVAALKSPALPRGGEKDRVGGKIAGLPLGCLVMEGAP